MQQQGESYAKEEDTMVHDFTDRDPGHRPVLIAVPHLQRLVELHAPDPGHRLLHRTGGGHGLLPLVTCTPYGVNSHRMLVRGHRIDTVLEEANVVRVTADAVQIEPMVVAPIVAAPVLLILLFTLLIPKPRKNRRKDG